MISNDKLNIYTRVYMKERGDDMESEGYRRVTRKDVAERAGVSPTIVSYVVNNNRYVDQEKRARVLQAIEELNYQPNAIAKSLKSKKSNHIAFIADEIENEHFGRIVREMESYAYQKGYLISLCNSRNEETYITQMISRQFDGVMISSNHLSEELIYRFPKAGIPTILFGNRIFRQKHPEITLINIDLYTGAVEAVQALIDKGYKKILFISELNYTNTSGWEQDLRFKGYKDTLIKNQIPFQSEYIIKNCINYEEVHEQCTKAFMSKEPPDAVFAHEDRLAIVAMSAAKQLKLEIPKDIAIIGFDNSTISAFTTPTLSTVEIPRHEVGKKAIELLYKKIQGKRISDVSFSTCLIERQSM